MSTRIISVTLLSAALLTSCSSPPDDRQGQCHPCTVSVRVGPLLKEAQQMIAARNYDGATAKLNEAEAVKFNPDDETVIDQFRRVIAKTSSQPSQP
jgi:hypothetical protein